MSYTAIKKELIGFVSNRKIAFKAVKVNTHDDTIKHLQYWLSCANDMTVLKNIARNHREKFINLCSNKRDKQRDKIVKLLDELSIN